MSFQNVMAFIMLALVLFIRGISLQARRFQYDLGLLNPLRATISGTY
jgi:hypothetical protein